jgi:hypothetical protein
MNVLELYARETNGCGLHYVLLNPKKELFVADNYSDFCLALDNAKHFISMEQATRFIKEKNLTDFEVYHVYSYIIKCTQDNVYGAKK